MRDGDVLMVDKSIEPKIGKVVIAAINGEMTVKRLSVVDGQMTLADNPASPMTCGKLSLKLTHRAFTNSEHRHEDLFISNLEIFPPNVPAIDLLPANLIRPAELNFTNLDAPAALIQASVVKIENLVSIG